MQTIKEPAEAATCEDTSEHANQENTRHASATFAHARSLNTHSLALVPLRWTSPLHGTVLARHGGTIQGQPETLKHDRTHTHTFFSRVGSATLRSTARQTCQCPRRFSIACATNPAWAHKTYLDLSCRRVAAGGARKETTLQWPAVLAANTHADNQRACRSSNLRGHE